MCFYAFSLLFMLIQCTLSRTMRTGLVYLPGIKEVKIRGRGLELHGGTTS